MSTYYNDIDPAACEWTRQLIAMGEITSGLVDNRSILDVKPTDLEGFERCHFFSGIAGWEAALNLAGWGGPVWTASLPCQPFSVAGKRAGTNDERHLWPVFHKLVAECHPPILFGEQVASKAGRAWLAAVFADLEALGYACAGADLCAAGLGAPHIRQRLYWCAIRLADDNSERLKERAQCDSRQSQSGQQAPLRDDVAGCGSGLGNGFGELLERLDKAWTEERAAERACPAGGVGDAQCVGPGRDSQAGVEAQGGTFVRSIRDVVGPPGPAGWDRVEYVPCLDGKWRPLPIMEAQPGAEPLAYGLLPPVVPRWNPSLQSDAVDPDFTGEARVMRLKGYGNAIVPLLAAEFILAVRAALSEE